MAELNPSGTNHYIWKAWNLYANSFQKIHSMPLQYNIQTKGLDYISSRKELKWFYVNMALMTITEFVSILYLYLHYSSLVPEISWKKLFTIYIASFIMPLILFAYMMMWWMGSPVPTAWKNLVDLAEQLRTETDKQLLPPEGKDYIGYFLYLSIKGFIIQAVTTTLFIMALGFDPLGHLFRHAMKIYIPPRFFTFAWVHSILLRFVMISAGSVLIFRLWVAIMIIAVHTVRMFTDILKFLELRRDSRFLRMYRGYLIIYSMAREPIEIVLLVLIAVGLGASVVINFTILKGYGLIDTPIYLMFCAYGVLAPVIISFLLNCGIQLHEKSKQMLEDRQRAAGILSRKILLKDLKASAPFTIYVGVNNYRQFWFEAGTKATYYEIIMNYTIDVILSYSLE